VKRNPGVAARPILDFALLNPGYGSSRLRAKERVDVGAGRRAIS
jgi:hypothetical protein